MEESCEKSTTEPDRKRAINFVGFGCLLDGLGEEWHGWFPSSRLVYRSLGWSAVRDQRLMRQVYVRIGQVILKRFLARTFSTVVNSLMRIGGLVT